MASELEVVRVNDDLILSGSINRNSIVSVGFCRVEVEDKETSSPFEYNDFVLLVLATDPTRIARFEPLESVFTCIHNSVEVV